MTENRPIVLLKLGGSLITEKGKIGVARVEVMQRLAEEIAAALPILDATLILGHGSGSFGHPAAETHGIARGRLEGDRLLGITTTQSAARELHQLVVGALEEAGVATFSLAPSSFMVAEDGTADELLLEPLLLAEAAGMVPLVFGDVATDRRRGVTILSTETVFEALVTALTGRGRQIAKILWLGRTDGVLDQSGRTVERIIPSERAAVDAIVGGAEHVDVTGGMTHRVDVALRLAQSGVKSVIASGEEAGALFELLTSTPSRGTLVVP